MSNQTVYWPEPLLTSPGDWPADMDVVDAILDTFVAAAGPITALERTALTTFVARLIAAGIWDKYEAIYVYVGSLNGAKYNLKDPAKFTITWFNNPVWYKGGMRFNGIDQWGDTNYNPVTEGQSIASHGLGIFIRTNQQDTGSDIGNSSASAINTATALWAKWADGNAYYSCNNINIPENISTPNSDPKGWLSGNRSAIDDARLYKNGVQIGATLSVTAIKAFLNANYGIARENPQNTYSGKEQGCSVIKKTGLTPSEAITENEIFTRLMLNLGRQIV